MIHNAAALLVLTLFASPSGKPQLQEPWIVISHSVYSRHLWLFKGYTWRPSKETQGKSPEGRTLETFIAYTKESMKGREWLFFHQTLVMVYSTERLSINSPFFGTWGEVREKRREITRFPWITLKPWLVRPSKILCRFVLWNRTSHSAYVKASHLTCAYTSVDSVNVFQSNTSLSLF